MHSTFTKFTKILACLSLSFFALLLVSAPVVYAVDPPPPTTTILGNTVHGGRTQFIQYTNGFGVNKYSDVTEPGVIIQRIVAIVFSLLGIVAVVMMIYAGFLWLTAGGEEDKANQGRTLLFQAVIGLIIILAAYSVVYFVLRQLALAIVLN